MYFCLWTIWLYLFLASKNTKVSCEVQFITAEIKRNNITIPNTVATAILNATSAEKINKIPDNKEKAKPAKGERKSEVYVVNNGLLLLHPSKVITSVGVKKSTEPVPPSINYHVIKKVKSTNTTDTKLAENLLENHLTKRSLTNRFQPKRKRKRHPEAEIGAKRLGIPNVSHGRIISVNKNDRLGKKNHKLLSFFNNRNRNRSYKVRTNIIKNNNNLKNAAHGSQIRGWLDSVRGRSGKRTDIESPLFDSDQEEYLQSARVKKLSERIQQADKRTKKDPSREIAPIKKVPDIRKYFDKPLQIHQYPRFAVRPFPGGEFPRFPISPSALSTYPRFVMSPQETQILHRFPIYQAPMVRYTRYPYIKPAIEFPRFENGLKRFTEYPRFEEIKPLQLKEYPRFPEPTEIPEIKDIENADKRGRSKRADISDRPGSSLNGRVTQKLTYEDDDEDDDGEDGNDGEEEDETYRRALLSRAGHGYSLISPIQPISHIETPPGIPDIADIPFLPEIPPLHGIHGIKPISPIKSIPPSDKTGTSRSLPTEAKDIAKIQSNNVSIKDLSKDQNTSS